ncbi:MULTISPECIES: class II glutamine amidotransferase [Acidianus]|uniref:Glutamine amidotransferase n=1 Tax=Candidatus Acidianus copahuensis TaxID=1160895 RepID=A0A031LSS8_9CREN|nr:MULTISPECIES: class II glutamine amidotransferase [Acidianus]EZQ10876.1 glutamine amidotransferase [Candidatus Acidianus copahuensis]NON63226.1 class II glutamine amidotransferase [Acidianus sp. RZ1]
MCRILAFHTKDKLNQDIVKAFFSSAEMDPLSKIYGRHDDGWGFVVFLKGNSWKKVYYRSPEPAFEDKVGQTILTSIKGDEMIGIIHARKTSKKFLVGLNHNHPYHLRSSVFDLYFAHNGSVNRKVFGENGKKPYTDSYLILEKIGQKIESGLLPFDSLNEVIKEIGQYSSSLNSGLISFSESKGPTLYVVNYFNQDKIKENTEYYVMYRLGDYVFSSTLLYYLKRSDVEKIKVGSPIEI